MSNRGRMSAREIDSPSSDTGKSPVKNTASRQGAGMLRKCVHPDCGLRFDPPTRRHEGHFPGCDKFCSIECRESFESCSSFSSLEPGASHPLSYNSVYNRAHGQRLAYEKDGMQAIIAVCSSVAPEERSRVIISASKPVHTDISTILRLFLQG